MCVRHGMQTACSCPFTQCSRCGFCGSVMSELTVNIRALSTAARPLHPATCQINNTWQQHSWSALKSLSPADHALPHCGLSGNTIEWLTPQRCGAGGGEPERVRIALKGSSTLVEWCSTLVVQHMFITASLSSRAGHTHTVQQQQHTPEIWPNRLCAQQCGGVCLPCCPNSSHSPQSGHDPEGRGRQASIHGDSHQRCGQEQGLPPAPAVTEEAKQARTHKSPNKHQLAVEKQTQQHTRGGWCVSEMHA